MQAVGLEKNKVLLLITLSCVVNLRKALEVIL